MTKLSNEEKYTVRKVEAEVINKDENYVVQEVVEDKGSYMEILKLDGDYQVKGLN